MPLYNKDRIGQFIGSGTQGSVLFIDGNSVLAQDNSNFFWDDANNRLGIGNAAPTTTLDVTGTATVSTQVTSPILSGGTGSGSTLTLKSNDTAWPRTSYTTTDHLTIGQNYTYPTGSAANLFAVVCSEAITGIDVTNPSINTFQVAPSWTYTVGQSWGLVAKAALNFTPNVVSNVGAGGTDNAIYAGINTQPQLNLSSGSRTWTNFWGLAVDPRQVGTSGTVTALIGIRNRGSVTSGTTTTNYYAITSDFAEVSGSTIGGWYGYSIGPSLAGTTTSFFGINIAPTITGTLTNYTGFKVTDSSVPSGTNIAFYHAGTNAHNRFQGKTRIGADTAPTYTLDVTHTDTATSGTLTGTRTSTTLSPASNSTSTVYALDTVLTTSTGAINPASIIIGHRLLANRNATDSGSVGTYRGFSYFSTNNAILSTGQGAVTTLLEGGEVQCQDNSSTTTTTTTMRGLTVGVGIGSNVVSSRVFTTIDGIYVAPSIASGATGTTVTNLNVINCDVAFSGALNRTGTITTAIGLNVSGWTTAGVFGSGLTFTNAPEQIRLESMSISGSMGIRQRGTTPHNRFEGKVCIGSDVAPNAFLEIKPQATSGTVVPDLLITSAAHTALTASIERIGVSFNLAATQQFSTGAIPLQRSMNIIPPTYSFVGASTITSSYNLYLQGAPLGGTNATISNTVTLGVGSNTVTNATNSYAIVASANSGATNNYALYITSGNSGFGVVSPTARIHLAAGTATANTSPLKFTSGTNLTAAEAGTVEYDGNRFYVSSLGTATRQEVVTSFLKDVTVITTNNTAAETTHYTTTVPGGTLGTSRGLKITIMGHILNNKGSSGTVQYRVKYGGTTVYDATHTVANNASERGTHIEVWITARNSASIQEINAMSKVGAAGTVAGVGAAVDTNFFAHYHGLTIASASDQTLAFTIQMSAASASFQVITDTVFVEYV
jgi:hypothetical protein